MKTPITGPFPAQSGPTAKLAVLVADARAFRWGPLAGKLCLAALGLVLLGAIGSSARARDVLSSTAPPAASSALTVDAAVPAIAPVAIAASTTSQALSVAASPEPSPAPSPAGASHGRATPDDPVYLNSATLADLHRLPGVGPKRAEAILVLRARLGHFRQIEELMKVKGIGRASLKKLRPLVRLDPPPVVLGDGGETPPPRPSSP